MGIVLEHRLCASQALGNTVTCILMRRIRRASGEGSRILHALAHVSQLQRAFAHAREQRPLHATCKLDARHVSLVRKTADCTALYLTRLRARSSA